MGEESRSGQNFQIVAWRTAMFLPPFKRTTFMLQVHFSTLAISGNTASLTPTHSNCYVILHSFKKSLCFYLLRWKKGFCSVCGEAVTFICDWRNFEKEKSVLSWDSGGEIDCGLWKGLFSNISISFNQWNRQWFLNSKSHLFERAGIYGITTN